MQCEWLHDLEEYSVGLYMDGLRDPWTGCLAWFEVGR